MVKLTVYLKFVKEHQGKSLTHSGKHVFKADTRPLCEWFCDVEIEDFESGGWELVEKRVVEISMYSGP